MTWQAIDLRAPEFAKPSDPPQLCGLIYAGKRHLLSGPPEAAKTLLALIFALEEIRAGGHVAVIDFESGPAETRRLLEDLGATSDEIGAIDYFEPDGPPTDCDIQAILDAGATLAIIDALAGAYDASNLDDEKRREVERFARTWIRPLWQHDVATIAIDHVVKNVENRGRFSIGSERKLGAVDVHLGLRANTQLHRGASGLITISTHKDRPAHLERPTAATVELHSDADTHAITWRFQLATGDADPSDWRPTVLMERVSRYIEGRPNGASRTEVYNAVTGKRTGLVAAVDCLVRDGNLEGVGSLLRSRDPYRDRSLGSPGSQAVPEPFPFSRSPSVPPVPPSQEGNGEPGNQDGPDLDYYEAIAAEMEEAGEFA